MRRTRSTASWWGIPAAVTNSGRVELSPRITGAVWVAVRKAVLATPMTGTPNWHGRRRPGRAGLRVQVGVPVDDQQPQPLQPVQDRVQRRQLAQVELARQVGPDFCYQLDTVSQQMAESGIGGHDRDRPGPPEGR
jgi:hypothetical protein